MTERAKRLGKLSNPRRSTSAPTEPRIGRLIVFEGPDGVGKTTLSLAVADALRTRAKCEHLCFPGREPGTLGHLVYRLHHEQSSFGVLQISPDAVQTLHIAAHLDAIAWRIRPAIEAGVDVVLDRFWWSTLAYGTVAGIDGSLLSRLIDVERKAWGTHLPSLTVLLRRDAPIGRDYEQRARWLSLRSEYDDIAESEGRHTRVLVLENAPDVPTALCRVLESLSPLSATGQTSAKPSGAPSAKRSHRTRGRQGAPRKADQPDGRPLIPAQPNKPVERRARKRSRSNKAHVDLEAIPAPHLAPAKVSAVYLSYWRFAAERQAIFFRRMEGAPAPWTADSILRTYKFTNAYRAADRASQYLIRRVIYRDDLPSDAAEVVFRILLFKLFNRIDTWELLEQALGPLTWKDYRSERYDRILTSAMHSGQPIYSAAYIMPPGGRAFGHAKKHRNHLALIERIMRYGTPLRLADMRTMQQAFELLRSFPTIGDFLAYQLITDINYSEVTNFSEMEFVMPGPGAQSGLAKCFVDRGGLNEPELIRLMAELQHEEFNRLGIDFKSLWGRPLQLIDCQNLFCEVDKYARVSHPEAPGRGGRTQIKHKFMPTDEPIDYWFPPKWKLSNRTPAHFSTPSAPR